MKQNLFNKLWLRVGMIVAIMTTALSGTAWAETVTYAVTSTSAVSTSGTAPTGSSASYSSTYNTACQLTKNNSMTLTLSGYEGYKITGITLSMKSNSKGGSGSLSVTAGSTDIASISTAAFNTASWHGAWSTSYVDVTVSMDDDSYEIQADEDVVITIAATANSLYCESFTLTYEEVTGGGSGLTASDLAITDAPVALSFDLYDNSAAQTVSYTTSSTGAITITPASPTSYFSYVHDATNKTITVTPLAVTSSAQNVTISQEADATYAAGSKTFTVNITDSTPFAITDGEFDFTVGEDYGSLCPSGSSSSISDQDEYTWTAGNVTLKTAGRHIWENKTCLKLYKSTTTQPTAGYIEVSVPSGYNITKIEFTMGDKNYLTGDGLNNAKTEWTGESRSVTISTGTDRSDIEKVIVTYEAASPLASIALSGTYQTT